MGREQFEVIDEDVNLENQKKGSKSKRIVTLSLIVATILIVVGLSLGIVFSSSNKNEDKNQKTTSPLPILTTTLPDAKSRIDCLPWLKRSNETVLKQECSKIPYCKYDSKNDNQKYPSCFIDIDDKSIKYTVSEKNNTSLGESYVIQISSSLNKVSSYSLSLDFQYLDDNTLRFTIKRIGNKDYEVPEEILKVNRPNSGKAKNPRYKLNMLFENNDFKFQIIRSATNTILWDTSLGPILFEDQARLISTKLPSENIYGMGENRHESFKHNLNYQNWPVWARDEAPEKVPFGNLYGSQPFYTCMEKDGKSHGVVLVNSNAFDYELIPNPGIVYRVTGGVLDFYVFLGPEPENVIQQYTQYFGRTFFPPYWSLGFQISRYGYKDVDDMENVLAGFEKNEIPLDTHVADIDHFDQRKDFTIDPDKFKELPEYFDELHRKGMKTVMILDPALVVNDTSYWPFNDGLKNNVFIKWPNGTSPDRNETKNDIMLGYCWPPGKVAYPDFFKKSTQKWWKDSIKKHYGTLKFDGLWIDMNEPAVFGTNEERPLNWPVESLPYWSLKCPDNEYESVKTKASYLYRDNNKLSDKTLCMNGIQGEKDEFIHFNVHNLYGLTESIPTYEAASEISGSNSRGFVITRSTFIGSGRYGGHWTGDNHSLWRHLYYSIIGMLEFNLFGIPYVGADICGFWGNTTVELCARWSSLGAFYPFSRNHNNEEAFDQDPASLGPVVISANKKSLEIRYKILPYYYTLFYKAHLFGNTVARPLFHEFTKDSNTYSIDKQFLIGPAFLVTPVLEEGKVDVNGYFPQGRWYDYHSGKIIHYDEFKGRWYKLDSPTDHINLHLRGGYILPTQDAAKTTEASRKNPFGLIVAVNNDGEATGDLFYDDGKSELSQDKYYFATFHLREYEFTGILKMNVEHNTYSDMDSKTLNTIRMLYSFDKDDQKNIEFYLNDNSEPVDKKNINFTEHDLTLTSLNLPMNSSFSLEWREKKISSVLVDCSVALKNKNFTEDECENNIDNSKRGCSYNSSLPVQCFIPNTAGGYFVHNECDNEYELIKYNDVNLFPEAIENLTVKITHGTISNNEKLKLTRIEIFDSNSDRFRVPLNLNFEENLYKNESFLAITVKNSTSAKAFIEVKNNKGKILFTTESAEQGLLFYNQFIQIVLNLVDYKNVYGFGENTHSSFKHEFDYRNWWGIFGRDQGTGGRENLYGAQPFFMAVDENDGRAFGTLILNSNAQEYGLLPPSSISFRTLGGILDLYIMEESSPESLIGTYTSLIGTTYMPPYWALGFQLSRYGYNNIENLKGAVNRTISANIPLDIQYADIDHFRDQLDFTYDTVKFKGLPEYIDELRGSGIKFIIILDPAINSEEPNYKPYLTGVEHDVYIKWPEDENPQKNETTGTNGTNPYLLGYVWPTGKATFPDFFKNQTIHWWKNEIKEHYKNVLKFDGLWIDMNEPANFDTNLEKPWNWPENKPSWNLICPKNNYDDPPYLPIVAKNTNSKRISDKTICMRALQGENDEYIHYDVHSLYGWTQSKPTLDALRELLGKRSVVISRSNYPSSGTYVGHWLGDNTSIWSHLKKNIIGLLEYNLFGVSYIGADICGFFEDTTAEMCTRWMQMGAFNTFFRNHNGFNGINQDPAALGLDVAAASRKIVEIRYNLLPYLYTLFYNANKNGGTVIRSLMHEFPADKRTLDIDRQFMWGSELLISPVVDLNKRTVYAYFPKARWFDYYTGKEIEETGRMHELDVPLDYIPLHIKGGSILVTQEPAMNTEKSRKNPFGLIIAPKDKTSTTKFDLYYDDGDSIDPTKSSSILSFTHNLIDDASSNITCTVLKKDYEFLPTNKLDQIRIFGVQKDPTKIQRFINDKPETSGWNFNKEYNSDTKELVLTNVGINLKGLTNFSIVIS